jgi:hypothetical protein
VTTPDEVVLEAGIPIEEAKKALEKLVCGGSANIRVQDRSDRLHNPGIPMKRKPIRSNVAENGYHTCYI